MKTVIVVPTIREQSIQRFLREWQFDTQIIVVEDNPEKTFDISGIDHYSWKEIDNDLGNVSWIIPRRSDCVRSYGYYKAYQSGADYIITLDDDCYPLPGMNSQEFIRLHVDNLEPTIEKRWYSTLDYPTPRGVPYSYDSATKQTWISHGLWENVLDYDSMTQLVLSRNPQPYADYKKGYIPQNMYYPMCGMNLAWRRECTPLMYFLLMGQDTSGTRYEYDRFGDIWAGILSKKVLDHLGIRVYSGMPNVHHDRASNVWANHEKEHLGIRANETFWLHVDSVQLTRETPLACYRELAEYLPLETPYWQMTKKSMKEWVQLYE